MVVHVRWFEKLWVAIFGAIYYRFLLGLTPFSKRFGEELVEQAIRGNRAENLRG